MGGWCSHKIAQVPSRPGPPCKAATGLCHPAPPHPASRGRCARRTVSSRGRGSVAQPGPWRPAESQAAATSPRPRAPAPVSFSQTTWRTAGWVSGWQRGASARHLCEAGSDPTRLLRAGGAASQGKGWGRHHQSPLRAPLGRQVPHPSSEPHPGLEGLGTYSPHGIFQT